MEGQSPSHFRRPRSLTKAVFERAAKLSPKDVTIPLSAGAGGLVKPVNIIPCIPCPWHWKEPCVFKREAWSFKMSCRRRTVSFTIQRSAAVTSISGSGGEKHVLVAQSPASGHHRLGGVNNRHYFLTVLEAESPRSGCQLPVSPGFLAPTWPPSPCVLIEEPFLCASLEREIYLPLLKRPGIVLH